MFKYKRPVLRIDRSCKTEWQKIYPIVGQCNEIPGLADEERWTANGSYLNNRTTRSLLDLIGFEVYKVGANGCHTLVKRVEIKDEIPAS